MVSEICVSLAGVKKRLITAQWIVAFCRVWRPRHGNLIGLGYACSTTAISPVHTHTLHTMVLLLNEGTDCAGMYIADAPDNSSRRTVPHHR